MVGGIALLVWIKTVTDPLPTARRMLGADYALLVQLLLSALTGLLLLALRETRAMGLLLSVHLGTVFSLFLTMPYSKFVHGLYRFLALIRHAGERRATAAAWSEGA